MSQFEIHPMPPILGADVVEQLSQAEVATIGHWRKWGFPNRAIQRIGAGHTIVGTAITVACPSEDNSIVHHAISLLRAGDILLIDRLGDTEVACWGGGVNHAAKLTGAAAVIIDGPCTDIREIRASGFPIWCRGVSGRTSLPLGNAGRINVPVSIGGAVVMPGDAVLCDDDGLVVLSPDEALSVAQRALEHQARTSRTLASLDEGRSLSELSGAAAKILSGAISK
ncbi:RraA family protein [Sphingobium fuliginis]|uniref:Putative 4-hydroxy-4-methyl-2-oxoglutarate aldolase n=1 Tax=Sphingobium fuliginis (strain ATCC 27551) TaxID=336203 RepID=A0A292ZIW6_SPHSA|nr:RraA family protein [Sphingobium fuliginis]GAY22813.1 demethylmenaquinone methyltransferase [Sphingobium fuliginis]